LTTAKTTDYKVRFSMPHLPKIRGKTLLPILSTLVLFLSVVTGVALVQQQQELRTKAAANTLYVSKKGNNADGRSWTTAWNELDKINWSAVQSGDTILIDGGVTPCAYPTSVTGSKNSPRSISGGSCGMTYQSTLTVGKNGVTLRLASESGRNGSVVIFGGRSTPLPYCDQASYKWQTNGVRNEGISVGGVSNILLDGTKWSGIIVYGHNRHGIDIGGGSSDITIRNIEVFDNGNVRPDGDPDQEGVNFHGTRITFERAIIHDNGQDSFQSGGDVADFTVSRSWLYNQRAHPTVNYEPFNYCRHSDGIQIFGGGNQYGVTVLDSIFGPGFMQGFILGDRAHENALASIHDVTVRNTLVVAGHGVQANAGILTKQDPDNDPTNYVLDRVTVIRDPGDNWWNTFIEGNNHTVTNSVFYGGRAIRVEGNPSVSNNCCWQINDESGVCTRTVDPQFNDNDFTGVGNEFADFNFTSQNPQCTGSSITSIAQLFGSPSTPTPTSKPTPTPGLSPTSVPSPAPLPGLLFEAESGTITSPFTVNGGYVSQSVETVDPATGGRASYIFNISDAGDYMVKALVNANSLGSDSFFVNIDGEPVSPEMIWDIGVTNGFEEREVSWRGSGTPAVNEFVPKVFTLTAGEHELIIRGRERDTLMDRITVYKVKTAICILIGDIDCDSVVNILDFQVLNNNFGTADLASDLNGDGIVNILDFQILSNNFGKTSG